MPVYRFQTPFPGRPVSVYPVDEDGVDYTTTASTGTTDASGLYTVTLTLGDWVARSRNPRGDYIETSGTVAAATGVTAGNVEEAVASLTASIAELEETVTGDYLTEAAATATYVPAAVATTAGIDPTGATDSLAGLTALLAAANGAEVYLPTGTYRLSAPLVIPDDGTVIRGAGHGTILLNDHTGDTVQIIGRKRVTLASLRLDTDTPASVTGSHILLRDSQSCHVQEVMVANLTDSSSWAVTVEGLSYFNRINVVADGGGPNVYNGVRCIDYGGQPANANWIEECVLHGQGAGVGFGVLLQTDTNVVVGGQIAGFLRGTYVTDVLNHVERVRYENCGNGIQSEAGATQLTVLWPDFDSVTTPTGFGTVVGLTFLSADQPTTRQRVTRLYPPNGEDLELYDNTQTLGMSVRTTDVLAAKRVIANEGIVLGNGKTIAFGTPSTITGATADEKVDSLVAAAVAQFGWVDGTT